MKTAPSKYASVSQAINAGRYRRVLNLLKDIDGERPLGELKYESLYYHLLSYNRLQWLPEAYEVVSVMQRRHKMDADGFLEVALFYMLVGLTSKAEQHFRAALQLNPRSTLLATELAILYEQQGDNDRAISIYNQVFSHALQRMQIDQVASRALARLIGIRGLDNNELQKLTAYLDEPGAGQKDAGLFFSMARHFRKLGDDKKEIYFLRLGNKQASEQDLAEVGGYSREATQAQLDALRQLFPQAVPEWLPGFESSDRQYLFVLGMPRSGTTLTEQILGAHSKIGNSGESRAMQVALQKYTSDERGRVSVDTHLFGHYKLLTSDSLNAVIHYYENYQSMFSKEKIITDKELSSINRVGLLANIFPRARFLCVKRNPLDVATSLLQHYFKNATYANDALNAVIEYEAYYAKATHWKCLYPDRFIDLCYEELVVDPKNNILPVLTSIGLDWEDGMLKFYERSNSVRTPSLGQVRQELNNNSIDKWQRYESLLQPAIEYLNAESI